MLFCQVLVTSIIDVWSKCIENIQGITLMDSGARVFLPAGNSVLARKKIPRGISRDRQTS